MIILLLKAAVRGHVRRTRSGSHTFVRPYSTRAAQPAAHPDLFGERPPMAVIHFPTPAPERVAEPAGASGLALYHPARIDVDGAPIDFPDAAHAHLFALGRTLLGHHAPMPPPALRARLWEHFRGMVEHDPATGAPFDRPEHLLDLARDYADPEHRSSWIDKRHGTAASVIASGRHEAYWRRGVALAMAAVARGPEASPMLKGLAQHLAARAERGA